MRMRIRHRLAIQEHLAILHLDRIAANSNHAFDKVLGRILWKNEYHHVPTIHRRQAKDIMTVWYLCRQRREPEK